MEVKVNNAADLPEELCTNPYVTYQLAWEPNQKEYQTPQADAGSSAWHYAQKHTIDCATDYHIQKLDTGSISFHVWAYPYFKGSKGYVGVKQDFQVSDIAPKFRASHTI